MFCVVNVPFCKLLSPGYLTVSQRRSEYRLVMSKPEATTVIVLA